LFLSAFAGIAHSVPSTFTGEQKAAERHLGMQNRTDLFHEL
jgi:hypothetical protein